MTASDIWDAADEAYWGKGHKDCMERKHAAVAVLERCLASQATAHALELNKAMRHEVRELAEERLRGEQAVAELKTKHFEEGRRSTAAHQSLREEADARVALERRNWESYREGEKERIEAAVAGAYRGCIGLLAFESHKSEGFGEIGTATLLRELIEQVKQLKIQKEHRAKPSPTDSRTPARDQPPVSEPRPFSFFVGQF